VFKFAANLLNFMNMFILSRKDLYKLSIMILIASILFGIPGLIIMMTLQWVTMQRYAQDDFEKHGISQASASRLGGVSILFSWLGLVVAAIFFGYVDTPLVEFSGPYNVYWLTILSCGLLGLIEDLHNNVLSPKLRLLMEILIFSFALYFWPLLIPVSFEMTFVNELMRYSFFGWLITVIFCVGFINAVNMADGANGLMSGVMTIAFGVFYLTTNEFHFAALMTVCGIFTIFNIISGKLFMGDCGAYGLGACAVMSSLYLFSIGYFSASFLACLFAYPCIEIVCTLSRRIIARRSIFLPDNDHLHNRLHSHFKNSLSSSTLANSLTGLFLVFCSSGITVLGFIGEWPLIGNHWVWMFIGQAAAYVFAFICLGIKQNFKKSEN